MLIMLIAFGSVVAMGLPIVTALFGLLVGVAVLEMLTHFFVVPTFSPEMATMIGLGVGIDYALFVVTRYRQGLAEGRPPPCHGHALATVGPVGAARRHHRGDLAARSYLIGQPYMIGVATASIVAVLLVMVATLTFLPALLGYAGRAIDRRPCRGCPAPRPSAVTRGFGIGGAGPCSGGRGSPVGPRCWSWCCSFWPSRSSRCAWPLPTRGTTRPTRPRARPMTSWPRDLARDSTAPWS